jgi:hypothetical protein
LKRGSLRHHRHKETNNQSCSLSTIVEEHRRERRYARRLPISIAP